MIASARLRECDCFSAVEGMTALGMAVKKLDVAMVKLLIESGARLDVEDVDHNTAKSYLPERTAANAAELERVHLLIETVENNAKI